MTQQTAHRALTAKPSPPPLSSRRDGDIELPARSVAGPVSDSARLAADVVRLEAQVMRLEAEVTALRSQVAELEASAQCDPLTGLLNHRGFARELARAIGYLGRYPARAALVYLDLDRFKPVNDRHGHSAGDAMLQAVAATLMRHVRASDSVARLGGDEFGVLLWNLSESAAHGKASELEAEIARTTLTWNGRVLSTSASSGVTPLSPRDTTAEAIARADQAMYACKSVRHGSSIDPCRSGESS